jgi:hypothetical protein
VPAPKPKFDTVNAPISELPQRALAQAHRDGVFAEQALGDGE